MKNITPNAFGHAALGDQNITLGFNAARDPVSASAVYSFGMLPANCVIKALRGTIVTPEGEAGNLIIGYRQNGGSATALLTINANGSVGARTTAPSNLDAVAAVPTVGAMLDTGTAGNYELVAYGSAALDAVKAVIQVSAFFGATTGDEGSANLFV